MSRSVGFAHIKREADGSSVGVWGAHSLRTAFQPIFAFREGRLEAIAFEGLLRPFRDGTGVSPGEFFEIVPDEDRIHVESLARNLHLLNAGTTLDPAALVFINFDPGRYDETTARKAVAREMRLVLHEAEIAPDRIVCEITEKTSQARTLKYLVAAMRDSGCYVAVDDFGAEDSGIERIRSLRPDIVKFDAAWIAELMRSEPGIALLHEMVEQFSGMGIHSLFEGIEEGWQVELAERAGASMVQGYALARPQLVPADFQVFMTGSAESTPSQTVATSAVVKPTPRPASVRKTFGRRGD